MLNLFKPKADLMIKTISACLPGVVLPVEVHLTLREPLKPRQIRVELLGQETYYIKQTHTNGKGHTSTTIVKKVAVFAKETKVVAEQPVLMQGEEEFWKIKLPLPPDAPPTCRGKLVDINWRVKAVMDVPMHADAVSEFPVQVLSTPPAQADLSKLPTEKRFDDCTLILEAPRLAGAEETLFGRLRLQTTKSVQVRGIRLELTRWEDAGAKKGGEIIASQKIAEQTTFSPYDSPSFDFNLALPSGAVPTTISPHSRLHWSIKAVLDRRLRTDFNIEQDVFVFNAPEPPAVKNE